MNRQLKAELARVKANLVHARKQVHLDEADIKLYEAEIADLDNLLKHARTADVKSSLRMLRNDAKDELRGARESLAETKRDVVCYTQDIASIMED